MAVVHVAQVERQSREVRLAGRQPVQGQAEPQAVEIPSQRESDRPAEASTQMERRAAERLRERLQGRWARVALRERGSSGQPG
jgi:hypothetical protein